MGERLREKFMLIQASLVYYECTPKKGQVKNPCLPTVSVQPARKYFSGRAKFMLFFFLSNSC